MISSTVVMWILMGFYVVIGLLAAREHNWWRAVYFVGAILISLSILMMTEEIRR